MRMFVSRLRVPMGLFTVLMGRCGVLLGLVVFTILMVMGRLVVMVSGGGVARGCLVMMLGRRMFSFFGHDLTPGC
jgi:hypothetical protein